MKPTRGTEAIGNPTTTNHLFFLCLVIYSPFTTSYIDLHLLGNVPISKVLCGNISNGQLGQHHLSTTGYDALQLVVKDGPLSIYYSLVLLGERERERTATIDTVQPQISGPWLSGTPIIRTPA